jgi:hypothetical protein
MLRMCVYMHSRFIENHPIWILEDGLLISEGVLSQGGELQDTPIYIKTHPLLLNYQFSVDNSYETFIVAWVKVLRV